MASALRVSLQTAPMFGWNLSSEPNELLGYSSACETRPGWGLLGSQVPLPEFGQSFAGGVDGVRREGHLKGHSDAQRLQNIREVFVTFRVNELPEQNVESRLETRYCHHPLILSSQGSEIFPWWGVVPTRDSDAQVSIGHKRVLENHLKSETIIVKEPRLEDPFNIDPERTNQASYDADHQTYRAAYQKI
ncbi:hypothetical protein PIB30_084840 [Stylosanthes scabra]|uniref:Uncharacterized protein n=1 Tax=Stylosanthes scabra TaxID=79078 RepID=A0ABU6XQF2_9FABA|nr:hypothetical protein [Stylosanthes scabra]